MKKLLAGIAFAFVTAFASQALARSCPTVRMALGNMGTTSVETFRPTHNDQRRPSKAVRLHAVTVLLLGAIVGLILWTPALPWLFKSLGLQ